MSSPNQYPTDKKLMSEIQIRPNPLAIPYTDGVSIKSTLKFAHIDPCSPTQPISRVSTSL
jgi:hypothetical protein